MMIVVVVTGMDLQGQRTRLTFWKIPQVVSLHWSWNVDGLGHRLNYPKHVRRAQRFAMIQGGRERAI